MSKDDDEWARFLRRLTMERFSVYEKPEPEPPNDTPWDRVRRRRELAIELDVEDDSSDETLD